jgi:predicted N-acyltransferase
VLLAGGAGIPVTVLPGRGHPLYDPLRVLGTAAGVEPPDRYPVAVSVAPGFVAGAAYAPGADRERAAAAVVDALGELAAARGCRAAAVLHLPATEAPELAAALAAAGYRTGVVSAECWLELAWDSFDGYLAMLPRNRRTSVKREIRAFAEGGLTTTLDGAEGLTRRTAELHSAWRARYGTGVPVDQLLDQYARIGAELADRLRLVRVWRDGEQVAFSLFYVHDGIWYGRACGFDYDRLHRLEFGYFNTTCYAPLRHALAEGARRMELSIESYQAKLARGCRLRPLSLALRTDEAGLADLLAAADARTRARLAELAG